MKESQTVTTGNHERLGKVEQGKRLAEWNRKNKEKLAHETKAQKCEANLTYYGAGAVVAIWVLYVVSYYVYQSKTPKYKPKEAPVHQPNETPDKFNMD